MKVKQSRPKLSAAVRFMVMLVGCFLLCDPGSGDGNGNGNGRMCLSYTA